MRCWSLCDRCRRATGRAPMGLYALRDGARGQMIGQWQPGRFQPLCACAPAGAARGHAGGVPWGTWRPQGSRAQQRSEDRGQVLPAGDSNPSFFSKSIWLFWLWLSTHWFQQLFTASAYRTHLLKCVCAKGRLPWPTQSPPGEWAGAQKHPRGRGYRARGVPAPAPSRALRSHLCPGMGIQHGAPSSSRPESFARRPGSR